MTNLFLLSLTKIGDPQIDLRLKLEEIKNFSLEYGSSYLPFLHFLGHYENPFLRFLSLQILQAYNDLNPQEIKKFLLDPSLVIRDYTLSHLSSEQLNQQDLTLVIRDPSNYFEAKPLPIIQKTIFLMKKNPKYQQFLNEMKNHSMFFDFQEEFS